MFIVYCTLKGGVGHSATWSAFQTSEANWGQLVCHVDGPLVLLSNGCLTAPYCTVRCGVPVFVFAGQAPFTGMCIAIPIHIRLGEYRHNTHVE